MSALTITVIAPSGITRIGDEAVRRQFRDAPGGDEHLDGSLIQY